MKRIAATLLLGLAGTHAVHADCPQELAVYSDADETISVEFVPNDGGRMMASNIFKARMAAGIELDGYVIWNVGVARPNGIMLHGCPEGDATGEEIAACTVWEGVIYAVDGSGNVDYMPVESEKAAEQLLFPDLGRGVRYSAIWGEGKVEIVPQDVLKLSGCQE